MRVGWTAVAMSRKVERWVAAGLIDAAQAERIIAYEAEDHRPLLLYAIAGLGGVAVATGLLSLVAANWAAIPAQVKIGVDLLSVGGLGFAILRLSVRGPRWAREAALLVFYGLILASVVLVGQVYQLGGRPHEALILWTVLTAVIMWTARTSVVALVWVAGVHVTFVSWLFFFVAWPDEDRVAIALPMASWVVIGTIALGGWRWLRERRPALAGVLRTVGWVEAVIGGSVGTCSLYTERADIDWSALWVGAAASVVFAAGMMATFRGPGARSARLLLLACVLLALLPPALTPGALDFLAALTFVGLWLLVAWAAYASARVRVLHLATAVVALRIIAVYFEILGTRFDTGLGLVGGGLFTLFLVGWWLRTRRDFRVPESP